MTAATITAVIPTRRRPRILGRAIESVLSQTWPHLRVAVFDNASGDDTQQVVERYRSADPRVAYHRHEHDIGAARNFQAGMDAVTTPWFSFLSDDDVLLPRFYERAMARLVREPRARFFCAQAVRFHTENGHHEVRPAAGWRNGYYAAGEGTIPMIRSMFTWTATVFSADVRTAGPLDDVGMADLPFLVEAAATFPFLVSLVPGAVRVYGPESALARMGVEEVVRSHEATAARLAALDWSDDAERIRAISAVDELLARRLPGRLNAAFLAGDRDEAGRIGALLARRDALTPGRRLRLALLERGGRFPRVLEGARRILRAREGRGRPAPGSRATRLDDVIRHYSAAASDE